MAEQDFTELANSLIQEAAFQKLEQACRVKLSDTPADAGTLFYLSIALHGQAKLIEALNFINEAIAINIAVPNWYSYKAALLVSLGRPAEALSVTTHALSLVPNSPDYLTNVGVAYQRLGNFQQAIVFYEQALKIDSLNHQALINKAAAMVLNKQYTDAKFYCLDFISRLSNASMLIQLYNVCSEACVHLVEWEEALELCNSGLELQPDFAKLLFRKGLILSYLSRFDEAQQSINIAYSINPDIIESYFKHNPSHKRIQGLELDILDARSVFLEMAYLRQSQGDWRLRDQYESILDAHMQTTKINAISPSLGFQVFTFAVSPAKRLQMMRRISSAIEMAVVDRIKPYTYRHRKNRRLRVGYLSPDFRNHPTAILSRQLYEMHSREDFKVYAYSIYPEPINDYYKNLIANKCDVFRDTSTYSSIKLAEIIQQDGIDILIDLAGYTSYSRPEVMAMRPSPIQISFLGFISTMGADFIDYAMVDDFIVTDNSRQEWHEKLIRLPHSLYLYDNELDNNASDLKREDFGLPENAIVFCCMNHEAKFDPVLFTIWMDILKAVPNSILWLLGSSDCVRHNLHVQASQRGIATDRILFAGRVALERHLKRYQLADLFLDTHLFNGHTTSLEALWQGLPVISHPGNVASSRVAASFLRALDLTELIANDLNHYKEIVLHYATNAEARRLLKNKLLARRNSSALFDTSQKVKYIEKAYKLAWERHEKGLVPDHIDVPF